MNRECKLTDIHLWKETDLNGIDHYYLCLEYLDRINNEVYKHIYPKVDLGITSDHMPMELANDESSFQTMVNADVTLAFQEGKRYQAYPTTFKYITRYGEEVTVENSYCIIEHLTKDLKKPKKMTMEEIEKELGYKIELVSEGVK